MKSKFFCPFPRILRHFVVWSTNQRDRIVEKGESRGIYLRGSRAVAYCAAVYSVSAPSRRKPRLFTLIIGQTAMPSDAPPMRRLTR